MEETNGRPREGERSEGAAREKPEGWLQVVFGPETGKRCQLAEDRCLIGRGAEADFILDDMTISRRHAAVERRSGGFAVVDLGSGNGTRLNGQPVSDEVLEDGATIELGSTVMLFHFGAPEKESPAMSSIRASDTQELPALSGEGAGRFKGESSSMMKRRARATPTGIERRPAPSPALAALASWLVVFALVGGGLVLILSMIEGSGTPKAGAQVDGQEDDNAPPAPKIRTRKPGERPPLPEPTQVYSASDNAPDVALERFREAVAREKDGELDSALSLYRDISSRYPEFIPPEGLTIAERIESLDKQISNAATIRWARDLLDSDAPDKARLNELLLELASIPATDGQFGEEAMLLTDRARSRLKQIELGMQPESSPAAAATGDQADVKEQTDTKSQPTSESGVKDRVDSARAKAAAYYRQGAFSKASKYLTDAAAAMEDSAARKELEDLAADVDEFSHVYEEGRSLSGRAGRGAEAIEQLEKASALDSRSFDAWSGKIDATLAEVHATLAGQLLDKNEYAKAREHLDKASHLDSSLKAVAKVESLFSFRCSSLLRQAQESSSPETMQAIILQVLDLAPRGSASEKEARVLLDKLPKLAP